MSVYLWPVKLLGWSAAGLAMGVGWKVGNLIYDKALGEEGLKWPDWSGMCASEDTPVWKRKFGKVS